MRNPIPADKPRLLVLIQSQFELLASLVVSIKTDPHAKLDSIENLSVSELQALALRNAIKIFDLLSSRSFTGSF